MKREIKFRAWTGKYMMMPGGFSIESQTTYQLSFGGMELMQYTGLKDKNGKEIYEGDILHYTEKGFDQLGVVEFYLKTAGFAIKIIKCNKAKQGDIRLMYNNSNTIIGNIYEDSELLK